MLVNQPVIVFVRCVVRSITQLRNLQPLSQAPGYILPIPGHQFPGDICDQAKMACHNISNFVLLFWTLIFYIHNLEIWLKNNVLIFL